MGTIKSSDWVQGAEDNHEDNKNIALRALDKGTKVEQVVVPNAFLYEHEILQTDNTRHQDEHRSYVREREPRFPKYKINRCVIHRSLIFVGQRHAYS